MAGSKKIMRLRMMIKYTYSDLQQKEKEKKEELEEKRKRDEKLEKKRREKKMMIYANSGMNKILLSL